MGPDNFRHTLDFANNVLSLFNITRNQTNVAAAVYADSITVSFNFSKYLTSSSVLSAIKDVPFLNETSLNITKALHVVKTRIFMTGRNDVPHVLVAFVSDKLNGNFTSISQELHDHRVTIIAIGVGDGFNVDHLKILGSKPETDYVLSTAFQHLDTNEKSVSGAISKGKDCSFNHNILQAQ